MNKDYSLEENVKHGTKEQPIRSIHFTTGKGTLYPDHFLVERHWHHSCEILMIRKGNYTVEIDLENYELHSGDICMIGSGELHQLVGDGPDTIHDVIIFDPQILDFSYEDAFQLEILKPFLSQEYTLPHILHPDEADYPRMKELYDRIFKADSYYEAKLLLLSMMYELKKKAHLIKNSAKQVETERIRIDRYKTLISYMEDHFGEKVTLQDLGRQVDCNTQYICHFFKEICGMSPMQYLIWYRIKMAQEMLQSTTKSVLQISLDCGFDNVSYFIRQFRRYTDMTPRQYRQEKELMDLIR